jgi:iron complex outermembrane receptor protein
MRRSGRGGDFHFATEDKLTRKPSVFVKRTLVIAVLGILPFIAAAAEDLPGVSDASATDSLEEVRIETARRADTLQLDTANVTGSRLGLSARELPASVTTVTHDVIELRGARTINDALYAAVGMTSALGSGSIPNYSTRGFTGNDITLMHDGIRQNTASQEARPMDAFIYDRIEVLKGPASLMYGEGAVGGAINYVSKSPDTMPAAEAFVSGGSWNSYRAAIGLGGPVVDRVTARLDVSENYTDGYVDRNISNYRAVASSVAWQAAADTKVTLYGTYLKDFTQNYYGTPVIYDAVINAATGVQSIAKANAAINRLVDARIDPDAIGLNYNNADNFVNAENSFTRLVLEHRFDGRWSVRNEAYFTTQHLNWRNTENYTWNPVTQLVDRSSFLLIWRQDQQLGDRLDSTLDAPIAGLTNRLVVGGLYDDNHQGRNSGQTGYATSPTPASVPLTGFNPGAGPVAAYMKTIEVVQKSSAVYAEDVLEPLPTLKLVGGVRYDHIDVNRISYIGAAPFTKDYNPVTGRFGVLYDLTSKINVYASYTRAAQPVSQLVGLTASQADFALQTARQYEIGSKASFWNDSANVTLAFFDIAKQHILTSQQVDSVIFNSQIGAQVSQGTELAFAFAPLDDWRIDANVAWTWKARFQDFFENTSVGLISRAGNIPPNVPRLVSGLFVNRVLGNWSANFGLRYVGQQQAAGDGRRVNLPFPTGA